MSRVVVGKGIFDILHANTFFLFSFYLTSGSVFNIRRYMKMLFLELKSLYKNEKKTLTLFYDENEILVITITNLKKKI